MLFFWLSSNVGVLYDRLWVRYRSAARTPGIDGARAAVERRPHTQVGYPIALRLVGLFASTFSCCLRCARRVVWSLSRS